MAGIKVLRPEDLGEERPSRLPRQKKYGELLEAAEALEMSPSEGEEGAVWMAVDLEEEKQPERVQQYLYQWASGKPYKFRTVKDGLRLWIKKEPRESLPQPEPDQPKGRGKKQPAE